MVLSQILCVPWTALQTNETVLQKMGQERKLLCCIEHRQLKFLGHVIRKGELENFAPSSRIPEKRAMSAQRFTFINKFQLCIKILDNYGMPPETEQNGKASHYIESRNSQDTEGESINNYFK